MWKISVVLVTGFLLVVACTHVREQLDPQRTPAAGEDCSGSQRHQKLFNVVSNNESEIVVEFGNFSGVLGLDSELFNYQVTFKGIHDEPPGGSKIQDPVVLQGQSRQGMKIKIPVTGTGVYLVSLFNEKRRPFWVQKIFSIAPQDKQLSEEEKKVLAETYAPIVSYHQDELYYPVSLEYLTNQVEKDTELDQEPFILTNRSVATSFFGSFFGSGSSSALNLQFKFKDLLTVLPYSGHFESVLKSGLESSALTRLRQRYGKNHVTVYYSIFENIKWKEILINYHFFYSYDPKNGTATKDALPSHIFDRESMTVVLRSTSRKPLDVYYGAHLSNQTMAQLDSNGEETYSWPGGRTRVQWHLAKLFGTHPIPSIALGSHGVYPEPGRYAVKFGQFNALVESAGGGDRFIHPKSLTSFKDPNSIPYELKDLELDRVTSGCAAKNLLTYSGATVDVLGPTNATFPPFTDREENFMSYADPNVSPFKNQK
ncbi:MAG: hypothetical protein JNM39_17840 [Bdellovibrionaceae bacterium]|nr:hypothetical protein [Pseudobdellovibrionaceae bacterium]